MADHGRRVLLLSNSTQAGRDYLAHAAAPIRAHFPAGGRIAFVPYALHDWDRYTAKAAAGLGALGYQVTGVHTGDPAAVVAEADGVFVGGGNTFRLTDAVYRTGLLDVLRRRVAAGLPYMGASAGTVLAGPSIRTTNDMPIVQPPSFTALGLVGFQINPHYVGGGIAPGHMGETREQRLAEYLEENAVPVVGLPEGSWITALGGTVTLGGTRDGVLFARGADPAPLPLGSDLAALETAPRAGEPRGPEC
ncbi:dipeptidase PepE [Marinitenerispora sediminis]|uniref:Dipeptidase PepE n=1 Tax=Marinitenerispora sediminis TaxID=1931232 RepID=A0A368T9F9_9ACTN|nr:dipeptidase PepE [Marinitenerispora sediminis]RCV54593.1 dipeptidase PepE [Marinitenerispora sediminis]RCV59852.1 dipeptidase PepE [Marinitenerispora sediminis]RCV61179.1 dipeptidase PepE [Marinitenerispora sediminis]